MRKINSISSSSRAFTMIELIFVIVIIGILSKFGINFLAQAYSTYIFSQVNNRLQAQSTVAVEMIGARLQFRIKDSVIARVDGGGYKALSGTALAGANVLEWVGTDIDGLRGDTIPLWSGVIDINRTNVANPTTLFTPGTNLTNLGTLIGTLSAGGGNGVSNIASSAIYFVGADTNISNYGYGGILNDQNSSVMHRIQQNGVTNNFDSSIVGVDFSGTDVYEYYQFAWTAYAVEHNTTSNDLILWYDYQPWAGETYRANGSSAVIMENVNTFKFQAIGSIMKIQVCVRSDITSGSSANEGYSLCKEKTIY